MKRHILPKSERLCHDKVISALFTEGSSSFAPPFRFYWRISEAVEGRPNVSVLFSVPKRQFKRAVKRNLLKRRMREAYRLNKSGFGACAQEKGLRVELALIYTSKEVSEYKNIEHGVRKVLAEITKRL